MPTAKLKTSCPHCSAAFNVQQQFDGRNVKCPKCSKSFVVKLLDDQSSSQASASIAQAALVTSDTAVETVRNRSKLESPLANESDNQNVGERNSAVKDKTIGTLGRFELKEILGQGAFGRVFRAYDPQLDRMLALKVPLFRDDERQKAARFQAEAKAAGRLRHPNIVPTFDSGRISRGS